MDAAVRAQVRGFVLNRFRGDATLLAPGPANLQVLTGVPTVAVVPMIRDHGVPEEDAVPRDSPGTAAGDRFVVVAAPHASNLEEFEPLRGAGAHLSFVRDARGIEAADWLILPGSKQTRSDLAWLKQQGMEGAIRAHIGAGRPTLAVCGGLQLLGERLEDPDGLDGDAAGSDPGLGILPLVTRYVPHKHLSRARARFAALQGVWRRLSHLEVSGYEIHMGRTEPRAEAASFLRAALVGADDATTLGWQHGSILGVYCHGLLENPAVLAALTGSVGAAPGAAFDTVADVVERSFTPGFLSSLVAEA
jgi:adenosylcobyric acid synthase